MFVGMHEYIRWPEYASSTLAEYPRLNARRIYTVRVFNGKRIMGTNLLAILADLSTDWLTITEILYE